MNQKAVSKRILVETISIMLITFLTVFVSNIYLKYLFEVPAFFYLIIELCLRQRSPRDIGFKIKQTPSDLAKNLPLLFLVIIVFQIIPLLIGKYLVPLYLNHVHNRMSIIQFDSIKSIVVFLVTIVITSLVCFYEELIYRGFFLERLSWFTKPYIAIGTTTILFVCMHFTPGNPVAVIIDMFSVLLDGILFGIIYFKTKNIFASFVAHVLVDIFDIILFMTVFSYVMK